MRLIDADELMEHVYMDKLDSRELIEQMIQNAPTVDAETVQNEFAMALDCEMGKNHLLTSRLGLYKDLFEMVIKLLIDRAAKN